MYDQVPIGVKAIGCPGAGVPGSCEQPDAGAGDLHRVVSPALMAYFMDTL